MTGVPSSEIVDAIYRLLPGFVTAWVFYGLTAHLKASSFERVIQALIFTLFVEAITYLVELALVWFGAATGFTIGAWNPENAFVWKVVIAISLGFVFAWFANGSRFHKFLPNSITKRTSYPSEWFSAFQQTERFVYLHFEDGRRLFGWPKEWPEQPGEGHIILEKAEWILPDNTRIPLVGIERMIVRAADVTIVEFEKEFDEIMKLAGDIAATSEAMLQYNESDDDDESTPEGDHSDVPADA